MRKFTLGLNAAKNIDYTEKFLKQKLRKIKFPQTHLMHVSTYAKSEARGSKDLPFLK